MKDSDLIKQIAEEEERPDGYISLEQIVNEIPQLDYNNPVTYHLYATYNKNILNEEEHRNVMITIDNLKKKRDKSNDKCLDYLEKNGTTPRLSVEAEDIQNSSYE